MKTAIITGASVGLGREFALAAMKQFPDIECYWLIARREEKLLEVGAELEGKTVKALPLDLCDENSFELLRQTLEAEKPEVELLINNSGCGYLGNFDSAKLEEQTRMIDLNIRGLTAVTNLVLGYMPNGARIVNVSSIASFCPNSRMIVYSAGKSYVSAFSRGLRDELRNRKINVTAVCPGPMDTEFITLGRIKGESPMFNFLPYCDPTKVASGALKASAGGRAVYTPRLFFKFYRLLAKLLPKALLVKLTRT
ncbi:MAG: SDR family NAD(P)-dependent oxidoreductase [Clostridia bacterium]|nr:SDR family NAD(P)-dependent oxidoreductase [Clostridia bacterium]